MSAITIDILKRDLNRWVAVISLHCRDVITSRLTCVSRGEFYHQDLTSEVNGDKVAWIAIAVVVMTDYGVCLVGSRFSIRPVVLLLLPRLAYCTQANIPANHGK